MDYGIILLLLSCAASLFLGYKYASIRKDLENAQDLITAHRRVVLALQKAMENDRHLSERLSEVDRASTDSDLNGMYAAATRIVSNRGS